MGGQSQPVTARKHAAARAPMLSKTRLFPLLWLVSTMAAASSIRAGSERGKDGPVSFGRQIAPIFALHCNGCHGESSPSSGFRTSSYKGLRSGGVLGDDVVAGDPGRSMLVKFIEGFRGPDQRMPQGSRPLTATQIDLIRRWIAEGAVNDHASTPCYKLQLPSCAIAPERPLRISFSVSVTADLILSVLDQGHRTMWQEELSIKRYPEQMDAGAPGQLLKWILNYENGWPKTVVLELVIRYAPKRPHAVLQVQDGNGSIVSTRELIASRCAPD
jgi:mono/diheme cytochrome c family protein